LLSYHDQGLTLNHLVEIVKPSAFEEAEDPEPEPEKKVMTVTKLTNKTFILDLIKIHPSSSGLERPQSTGRFDHSLVYYALACSQNNPLNWKTFVKLSQDNQHRSFSNGTNDSLKTELWRS
jgi:hypothetical protein